MTTAATNAQMIGEEMVGVVLIMGYKVTTKEGINNNVEMSSITQTQNNVYVYKTMNDTHNCSTRETRIISKIHNTMMDQSGATIGILDSISLQLAQGAIVIPNS
jgi:hypothetical protein